MTRAAVEILEDKAAGVRKGAVGLLGRLVGRRTGKSCFFLGGGFNAYVVCL
jgi:hypothetical protein